MTNFRWTAKANKAALELAQGKTRTEAAATAGISERTLYRWLDDDDFKAEVDRLSLMVDISSRAERMRIAMRAVREMVHEDGTVDTKKDLLDWLKYAQSETDGIKLGLTALLENHLPQELEEALDRAYGDKSTEPMM